MKMKSFPLILGMAAIMTVGGVVATWEYAGEGIDSLLGNKDISLNMGTFIYTEEIPDEEVTVIQRLSDILNKQYTTDIVDNSLDYLLKETITITWGNSNEPFVGSMDESKAAQINELFGDVLESTETDTKVSFILKSQDLNGDGYNEIAMYSTSDELDNRNYNRNGVVRVFVTVFTPKVDAVGNVTGYELVGEALQGYCQEICYSSSNSTPSFDTDSWRDGVAVYNWRGVKQQKLTGDDLNNFSVYNNPQGWFDDYTQPDGNDLSKVLADNL